MITMQRRLSAILAVTEGSLSHHPVQQLESLLDAVLTPEACPGSSGNFWRTGRGPKASAPTGQGCGRGMKTTMMTTDTLLGASTVLALCEWQQMEPPLAPRKQVLFYPHLTCEETEAKKRELNCPRSHGQEVTGPGYAKPWGTQRTPSSA